MNTPQPDSKLMLETLRKAVDKALDRKRRLGQYAVFWKDNKPVFTEGDSPQGAPSPLSASEDGKPYGK